MKLSDLLVYVDPPAEQWPKLALMGTPGWQHPAMPPKKSQGLQAQCVASVVTACVEFRRAVLGMNYISLSAGDLFGRLPSDETGTQFGYAIPEAMDNGIGMEMFTPNTFDFAKPFTGTPPEFRELFKSDWLDCDFKFGAAMLACANDTPVACGVTWRRSYTRVGPDGWLDTKGAANLNPFGHALMAYKPAVRVTDGAPEYGLWCWNPIGSFNTKMGSCCVIPQSKFEADKSEFFACVNTHS